LGRRRGRTEKKKFSLRKEGRGNESYKERLVAALVLKKTDRNWGDGCQTKKTEKKGER